MHGTFKQLAPNKATSDDGFTVWTTPHSGVFYQEGDETIRLASEWMAVGPVQIVIYAKRPSDPVFAAYAGERRKQILDRIIASLEFLGRRGEIDYGA